MLEARAGEDYPFSAVDHHSMSSLSLLEPEGNRVKSIVHQQVTDFEKLAFDVFDTSVGLRHPSIGLNLLHLKSLNTPFKSANLLLVVGMLFLLWCRRSSTLSGSGGIWGWCCFFIRFVSRTRTHINAYRMQPRIIGWVNLDTHSIYTKKLRREIGGVGCLGLKTAIGR